MADVVATAPVKKRALAEMQKELRDQVHLCSKLRKQVEQHPERLKEKLALPPLLALVDSGELTAFDVDMWPDGTNLYRWCCKVTYKGERSSVSGSRLDGWENNWELDKDKGDGMLRVCSVRAHACHAGALIWDGATQEPDPTVDNPDPDFATPYTWELLWARLLRENSDDVGQALCSLCWWVLNMQNDNEGLPCELMRDASAPQAPEEDESSASE